MSEELEEETDSPRDVMEGLLFDLGIFGESHHHSGAVGGGPHWRAELAVERSMTAGATALVAGRSPPSPASTGMSPSFGDDPLHELAEKCSQRNVLGEPA